VSKKFVQVSIAISFLFSACSQVPTGGTPLATFASTQSQSGISTFTPHIAASKTPREPRNEPTSTPLPPTPLPTIATFTPTFDALTALTVTPAQKAECPKENPSLEPTFYVPKFPKCFDTDQCVFSGTEKEILEFLNAGGSMQSVIKRLKTAIYGNYQEYAYQDVTNDTIPDLMFIDFSVFGTLHIFFCQDGEYQLFSSPHDGYEISFEPQKIIVDDLNIDRVPEVMFLQGYGNLCCSIYAFEWNGQTFQNLSPDADTSNEIAIKVNNQGGLKDIAGRGPFSLTGFYGYPDFEFNIPPMRFFNYIYSWNGKNFILASEEFEPPQYRFQAIQDGDFKALLEQYDQALSLYQDVIFSKKLGWWSPSQYKFLKNKYSNSNATLPPAPSENPTEYPRLSAYAYYRIMLIHVAQGHESDAGTVYKTLQQKFGSDPYGQPYVEMAAAFWDAYQATHKMYTGCAAAIQYAAEHSEILVPLGSDYHGSQSHTYVPADVCPFR
jgi:hypothetical protein